MDGYDIPATGLSRLPYLNCLSWVFVARRQPG
jgi:hypothetical protein